jgi:hypothetical protein
MDKDTQRLIRNLRSYPGVEVDSITNAGFLVVMRMEGQEPVTFKASFDTYGAERNPEAPLITPPSYLLVERALLGAGYVISS